MLTRIADCAAAAGRALARLQVGAALVAATLAASPTGAAALDCGAPLADSACADRPGTAGCGLLYLQISNLVEDGPVLNGLSLRPQRPVASPVAAAAQAPGDVGSASPAQCRGAPSGPLPPADTGSPDRDCVAYLLPACTYGIQARFGDGSTVAAGDIRVAAPGADDDGGSGCAKVMIDLGRRSLSAAPAACAEMAMARGEMTRGEMTRGDEAEAGDDPAQHDRPLGQLAAETVTAVTVAPTPAREP